MKQRVLFVCIHNGARSQMAEALLSRVAGDEFITEGAGLSHGTLNELAVEAMREIRIDISKKQPRSIDDAIRSGAQFDWVITVCDEGSAAGCPALPGGGKQLHWSFEDPSQFTGTFKQRFARTRAVRDSIQQKIEEWTGAAKPAQTNEEL